MRLFFIFILLISVFPLQAETYVYFQNNTHLSFNVQTTQTGTHTLSSGEWNISANSVSAWQRGLELMWTNRNSGIHNGDDFFFDMLLTNAGDSITLKLKLTGTFASSDMWISAAGPGFSHPWYSDNNFHQASFSLGGKNYTLKYHSYFTGGYDDIYFALQEEDPWPVNPADTLDPYVVNILAYNIFMLTPPIGNSDQTDRAAALPDHLHHYDAIIFSEAFYNSARTDLQNGIQQEYPYMTPVVDEGTFNDDGGVFIASRFPIDTFAQIVYDDCNGSDCLAAKGVMYAKIDKLGQKYHIFGTHTQAWPDPADVAVRILQFKQLQAFIDSLSIPTDEAVIIGGDLNVDMIANHLGEYDGMLDSLNLMEPTYSGHPYTYDGDISYYASAGVEFLDYVMAKADYKQPISSENKVIILRSIADDLFNMFDLSDHLAVQGRLVFSPPTTSTYSEQNSDFLKAYPNPVKGKIQLEWTCRAGEAILIIYDMLGRPTLEKRVDLAQGNLELDLSRLSPGRYQLNLIGLKESVQTPIIVKP